MSSARELVEYIAKALVDEPEAVQVEEITERGVPLVTLHVAPDDRGRVIGKSGRTAHAMRTLLGIATVSGEAPSLEIID
ncbi:MAG: KH domain-containing protein [Myxococcota bacterium]